MGNNNSTEAPRKPQKLTKARVGYDALPTPTPTAGLSSHSILPTHNHGRYSNSYLVGSLPGATAAQLSNESLTSGVGVAVLGDEVASRVQISHGSRHGRKSSIGAGDPELLHPGEPLRRSSRGAPGSRSSDRSSRSGSVPQEGFPRPLRRAESMQANGKRGSINYDMSTYEFQRFLLNQEIPTHPNPSSGMERSRSFKDPDVTENTWKSSHPHQASSSPVSRSNSEVSLYRPMRRRSMIRTPGVATRDEQAIQRISARSGFRNSLPTTPSISRQNSIESLFARRMSMPPVQIDLDVPIRVQTPSDAEYKQLGGMKFGSLRITNGAPDLTPRHEKPGELGSDKGMHTPTAVPGYFGLQRSPCAKESTENSEAEDDDVLHMTSRKLFSKFASPAAMQTTTLEFSSETKNTKPDMVSISDNTPLRFASVEEAPVTSRNISVSSTSKRIAEEDGLFDQSGSGGGEYYSNEVLNVKDDPNAKANPERVNQDVEHKKTTTLARSDSGFVSSPSSETSRQTLCKADSGYSSNVSLRSTQSAKKTSRDGGQIFSEKAASLSPERRSSVPSFSNRQRALKHDRSKSELPPPPPPPVKDAPPAVPARQSSLHSLARGTMNRIPVLRSSKSRDSGSFRTSDFSDSTTAVPLPTDGMSNRNEGVKKVSSHGRLRRLLSVGREDEISPGVPTSSSRQKPVDVRYNGERRRRHKPKAPSSHQSSLNGKTSKETLRTILSVGSTDMLQTAEAAPVHEETTIKVSTPRPSASRKRSLHSLSRSLSQVKANILPSRKPSVPTLQTQPLEKDVLDSAGPEVILDSEANASGLDSVQRSLGKSAFDQAITAIPDDQSPVASPLRGKTLTKARPMERRNGRQIPPLKTQRSAPDVTDADWPLSPTVVPELAHLRKGKTPPPVSMRTRSLKNLRTPSPGRARSAPVVPPMQHSPQETNRSHESINSQQSSHSSTYRGSSSGSHEGPENIQTGIAIPYPDLKRPAHQRSRSDGQALSPTWTRRPPQERWVPDREHLQPTAYHNRIVSDSSAYGQNPPFRVLHSYNSPSYRGVPIWG